MLVVDDRQLAPIQFKNGAAEEPGNSSVGWTF